MFWRFGGYSNVSAIDTLVEKPNVRLEELLDESDLIQELKSHHTKLIEFLREDTHLHALLNYVTAPGGSTEEDEDEDGEDEPVVDEEREKAEKQRLKYSYVACEILSCETWSITESLMTNTQYLTEFWDFLRRPAPLDPLQAGYFTKVNETLLEKKTEEMLDFFKSIPDIVPAMLQHVDCPMVIDLLLKIISLDKAEGGAGIVDWLHDRDLIPKLLSNLSPECNSSTQTSAGDFLKAIITISANAAQNEQSCIGPNSLTRQLVSESCIEQLITSMLQGGNPLTVGVGIVIEVIRKNNSDYDPESQNPDAPPTNHDPIFLGTLLRKFADHVPEFMELILSSKRTITDGEATRIVERGTLKSAWGTDIEPLGFDRFKTCELMAELLHCSNMGLLNEKGSEEYIKARDLERERLRAAGAFAAANRQEESITEASVASSKFETDFAPSASTSSEELRVANSSEEEGFEKVNVPESLDHPTRSVTGKLGLGGDLVDEPLSPAHPRGAEAEAASSTYGLAENVRRLSLEDTEMTMSSDEAGSAKSSHIVADRSLSPHPEDKPAPLFSRSKDPHKTPTPSSPELPSSPQPTNAVQVDNSFQAHLETNTSLPISDEIMQDSMADVEDEKPVVGDYLKIQFVENQVVPTILSFFFRFPWNNFLHNVVYDVVQQVFNGPMDRGNNRFLAFDLFESGRITEQVIEGQERSDEAQVKQNMRLGYMGHLTLVAEEVVKFGERHPKEVLSPKVQDYIYGKSWEQYVTKTLAETRERDNAILGGFRPENGLGPRQAVLNAVNAGGFANSNALANAGLTGGQQGLDSVDLSNNGSATTTSHTSFGSLSSGFGSSSDDEDEDMDEADDDDRQQALVQLSTADTGPSPEGTDQPVPLIPPPPAPLNIEPSRARRRLADKLALRKQQQLQAEQEASASEFGLEGDDPFASLGDDDEHDSTNPFSLDEEEQDITSFGKRSNAPSNSGAFSVSRGISNLFSAGHGISRAGDDDTGYGESMDDDESSSSCGSDSDHPLEARTSLERRPLDIDDDDDDDDDDEMGEMVAPSNEPNSSDEEATDDDDGELMSPEDKKLMGITSQRAAEPSGTEFDGQEDHDNGDDSDSMVEIALPKNPKQSNSASTK